jgi:hypothetical protein
LNETNKINKFNNGNWYAVEEPALAICGIT